ncbi:hypothetical protein L3Q82_018883 [Scortum barcoo]|uniref:Uncharacterized protein n=1 Tax=Scortum barcoo TaxID=214431 RepID=A0ACB8VFG4_9TELE|nr:hypothetical protein L3Q82_018883 [Scortum barcoo]
MGQEDRNPMLLQLLAQVLVMTWHYSVTGATQVTGEIGGNVTFHCPIDKDKEVKFFYLQKGDKFVNGFHKSANSKEIEPWNNTELSHNKTVVHMYKFECKYSKPEVTQQCSEKSCVVTCSAHGGYPDAKVTWSEAGHSCQMCKVVNSSEMEDPDTQTYNSSSMAHFNCSNGELKSLSCSVGNVTSNLFSVCTSETPSASYVIIAICVVVFITIMSEAEQSIKGVQRMLGRISLQFHLVMSPSTITSLSSFATRFVSFFAPTPPILSPLLIPEVLVQGFGVVEAPLPRPATQTTLHRHFMDLPAGVGEERRGARKETEQDEGGNEARRQERRKCWRKGGEERERRPMRLAPLFFLLDPALLVRGWSGKPNSRAWIGRLSSGRAK